MELWKTVIKQELKNYEISSLGRLRNKKSLRILKTCSFKETGHVFVRITIGKGIKKNYRIHRLVLGTFSGEIRKDAVVNHINNIPWDNRLENLEWCTLAQNSNRTKISKRKRYKIIEIYESREWNSAEEFYKELMSKVY